MTLQKMKRLGGRALEIEKILGMMRHKVQRERERERERERDRERESERETGVNVSSILESKYGPNSRTIQILLSNAIGTVREEEISRVCSRNSQTERLRA
jgi:hypothetical protein